MGRPGEPKIGSPIGRFSCMRWCAPRRVRIPDPDVPLLVTCNPENRPVARSAREEPDCLMVDPRGQPDVRRQGPSRSASRAEGVGLSPYRSFVKLIDLLPVPLLVARIVGTDDQGWLRDETRYVNRRFREVIGYTLEDFQDILSWSQLAYPDPAYRDEIIGQWNRSVQDSRTQGKAFASVTARIRCKDGQERWFDVVAEIQSTVRAEHHVVAFLEVTRLHEAMTELEALSRTDVLTSISNRRAMLQHLEKEVARAKRTGRPFAVVFCDLDHFKEVNDAHGHQCGDAVLAAAARRIKSGLRESDMVARWGGEEFCILLAETEAAGAWTLVNRIKQALSEEDFSCREGERLSITATFGIALHESGSGIEDTLRQADAALYFGKSRGRNCVVMYPGGPERG